jgi:hypothetical protein
MGINTMIELRSFGALGGGNHGWLDTKHHFSFSDYIDPARMSWGKLRVWNDDVIAPGSGFPPHLHRDMEIITYVRSGAITHEDSLGNRGRTEAGDVQVMSAGTGIRHSEYNHENIEARIFQIWILPDKTGDAPRWGTRPFPKGERAGQFVTLASGDDDPGDALSIRADAKLMAATLLSGQSVKYHPQPGRHLYLVPAQGAVDVNDQRINERDGAAIENESVLLITAVGDADVILVDVA